MIIGSITDGIVIDHIPAGRGMELYHYLQLDRLECEVAVIKNAPHMEAAKAMVDFVCSPEGQSAMAAYMEGTLRFTNTKYTLPEKSWLIDSSEIEWVERPVTALTEAKQDIIAHWNELKG